MDMLKFKWHKIAEDLEELRSTSGLVELEIEGRKVCIGLVGDEVHACASKCPHAGGRMSDGFIDALGNIVCPLHRYKFSLKNGRNTSGEGYYLKTYQIESRKDGIFIGFPINNLFG